MKKNILIINKTQFGYHTDYYKYCEYLRDEFDVTYLCFDSGLKKIDMGKVRIKYISNKGVKLFRGVRFILQALLYLLNHNGIVFIRYFEQCQIFKHFFPKKKMILDIRTLSVNKNEKLRLKHDKKIKNAINHFNFVTIISEGLRKKIGLNCKKSSILPLGSDAISYSNKDFNEIKLLYIGTLNGRNIEETIKGLNLFLKRNPSLNNLTYDVIGYGKELDIIKKIVKENKLDSIINIHGRVPHLEAKPFFDKCNIGISYIPITDYYDFQPPTKTFEYILSGMPCIATNTYENRLLINKNNGVLCDDNPESFANALEEIISNSKKYESEKIRQTLSEYTWENIVKEHLIPVLKKA